MLLRVEDVFCDTSPCDMIPPQHPAPIAGTSGAVIRERSKWGRLSGARDGRDVAGVAEEVPLTPGLTCSVCTMRCERGRCLYDAIKEGDLQKCRLIIEAEGTDVLRTFDEKGHTPAHWAALAGSTELLHYFVNSEGPVDVPSRAELGQHPIHWACVGGDISAVDFLLQVGVSLEVKDQKGSTPLITAAQYGQTALCCYLISKGAKFQACDSEGDNALHWAAFKGYCELTHLLLYYGCDPKLPDNYGQDGVDLETTDNKRNSPLKLAQGRKDTNIISYLQSIPTQTKRRNTKFDWRAWISGRPTRSKAPILFFYGNLFLWGYPTYFYQIVPLSYYILWETHMTFLVGNALMWFFFLKASLMDPGYLPCHTEEYDRAIKQAGNFNDWKKGFNPLRRLCHTCQLVRPLRSKHCRVTKRCVACFDHYCPYLYNNVGYRNRAYFVAFVATMCMNCTIAAYLCWDWFDIMGRNLFLGMGFLFLIVIAIISGGMTAICVYMAISNITTNERVNCKKYSYLKDEKGQFANPFDRGFLLNLMEFCHFIPPLKDEQIQMSKPSCI
ncbi:uncharacterized protein [Ambystoma mexicanum]|uniref:uncharacterized protein isoform X2 n=1 Tax=Ambystoma mexicanum TaxID=8296 RepID=UPI0037E7337C